MGAPWGGPICPGRCWAPCIGDCSAPACTPGKTILCELRIPTRLFNKKKSRLFNQKSFLLQSTQCLQECQSHASPPPPFVHCKFSLSSPKINRTLFFSNFFFSSSSIFFFPPFFHTPRAAVAGGREPRLHRNSEMLQIQAPAALLVSQSFRGGREKE